MTNSDFLRAQLTPAHLKTLVSAAVFERGVTYATGAAVALRGESASVPLDSASFEICADVLGTANYQTRLFFVQASLRGQCNCQGGQTGWFCKHQVATALVWHTTQTGETIGVDPQAQKKIQSSAKRAQTVADKQSALEAFILAVPGSELAAKVITLLRQDKAFAKVLESWRKVYQVTQANSDSKPVIAALLKSAKKSLHWHESAAYVKRAEPLFELLETKNKQNPATGLLLSLYAFERAYSVYSNSDDSGGQIGSLCSKIASTAMQSAQAAKPLDLTVAEPLFKAMTVDNHGLFSLADVLTCLNSVAIEKFKSLTLARYQKASDYDKDHMGEWLIEIFTQESDFDAAIAVFKADLSSSYEQLKLVKYLDKIGRSREAFNQAEKTLKADPDDPQAQAMMLTLYRRDGWHQEAYLLSKARLYKRFDASLLKAFYADAAGAGCDLATEKDQLYQAIVKLENRWEGRPNVRMRLEMLMVEDDWPAIDSLLSTDVEYPTHTGLNVVTQAPVAYRALSIKVCQTVVLEQLKTDSNPYKTTLGTVRLGLQLLPSDEAKQWLMQLMQQYKVKTRFVQELQGLLDET
jgi:tetratricopeptide (TPR) repeat protein